MEFHGVNIDLNKSALFQLILLCWFDATEVLGIISCFTTLFVTHIVQKYAHCVNIYGTYNML